MADTLVTFGIITDGRRPDKLAAEIASIRALGADRVEILVAGAPRADPGPGIRILPAEEAARGGRVSALRNLILDHAAGGLVVVADDDLVFDPGFMEALSQNPDFDLAGIRCLNPDGTRYWDWATYRGPRGHSLLREDEDDPFAYISGCVVVATRSAIRRGARWDTARGYYEEEDVEFSHRMRRAGFRLRPGHAAPVLHNDERYTQDGPIVIRLDDAMAMARQSYAGWPRAFGRWWLQHLLDLWPGRLGEDAVLSIARDFADESALDGLVRSDRGDETIRFGSRLPVRFIGPVFGRGARADRARAWAGALGRTAWCGIFHHGAPCSEEALNALPCGQRDALFRCHARGARMIAGIALATETDGGFYRMENAVWTIGLACDLHRPFSGARLADLMGLDEIWAPDRDMRRAMVAAGVPECRVRVIPGPDQAGWFKERLSALEAELLLRHGYADIV